MAGINEGDLLEGLSPHRFVGERHRAGAQTPGKTYAVRLQVRRLIVCRVVYASSIHSNLESSMFNRYNTLHTQEALEDGDDALFEHRLNLDVETTSKGNRQRFITAMYLRCSDEMKAAIVAHPGVRMGEDVIGAELAFWVALLDQHSVEAVQALVARGVDPRRLRMLEGNAILQITSFMWGVEDEHVELLEYLIGLGGFDLDATNQSGRPAMVTAIARD